MNDFALLQKLRHVRGQDSAELAMMADHVARSETPTAEALIMALHQTILDLRAQVRSLTPEPQMRRMPDSWREDLVRQEERLSKEAAAFQGSARFPR